MGRIIDRKIEKPTREMLGLAIRGELEQLGERITAIGYEAFGQVLGLCLVAAACIAVEAGGRWLAA